MISLAVFIGIGVAVGAVWSAMYGRTWPRDRMIAAYRLRDDEWTRNTIESFIRTLARLQGAGIAVGFVILAVLTDHISTGGGIGFGIAAVYACVYSGMLVGSAIAAPLALRRPVVSGAVRRASLAPRDARRFVPR